MRSPSHRGRQAVAAAVPLLWVTVCFLVSSCSPDIPSTGFERFPFDTVATLGVLDGDTAQVIGRVATVDVDDAGNVLILDGQTPALLLYDSAGRFLAGLRARGSGPGELAGPTAARWTQDGSVRVMDPRNGRMDVFGVGPEGFRLLSSIQPQVVGRSLCRIGDRWYTDRVLGQESFHELEPAGARVASFGAPLDVSRFVGGPVGPLIAETFAAGPITCAEDPGSVYALATALPIVRAFEPSGEALWEVTLDEYIPLRVDATSGTGVRSEPAENTGSHVALGLLPWDASAVLVQLEVRHREPPPGDADYHAIESRFLSVQDGSELGRTMLLPRVVATWRDRVYVIRTNPFPHVLVLRRRS